MISLDALEAAVTDTVGVRARIPLEPLGGVGDKVFPPTYSSEGRAATRYAMEERCVDGEVVDAVVLDSVASQANRMEMALLDAFRGGELALPVVSVDFAGSGLLGLDRLSSLEVSHRLFDAALRDSVDPASGLLFRLAPAGIAITEASPRNAAALFHYSPTTLLFGGWDSTGPRGGLGAKYERALTSEIVAIDVATGAKTSSRIDQLGVQLKAGPLYEAADGAWTLEEADAVVEKGKPKLVGPEKAPDRGRPSQVNHGNVTPSIDRAAGGVTAARIEATAVLSFAALRKLRFPTAADGSSIADRRAAEGAAWAALAALGVAAVVLAVEEGFDLRSRCVLAPTAPLRFELVARDGSTRTFDADRAGALARVAEAADAAAMHGLTWMRDELLLRPSDRLVQLIRRSQALTVAGDAEER